MNPCVFRQLRMEGRCPRLRFPSSTLLTEQLSDPQPPCQQVVAPHRPDMHIVPDGLRVLISLIQWVTLPRLEQASHPIGQPCLAALHASANCRKQEWANWTKLSLDTLNFLIYNRATLVTHMLNQELTVQFSRPGSIFSKEIHVLPLLATVLIGLLIWSTAANAQCMAQTEYCDAGYCSSYIDCDCDTFGCTEVGPPLKACLIKHCSAIGWGIGCSTGSTTVAAYCGPGSQQCPFTSCPCEYSPWYWC
jgi:hypothetical protein